MGIELDFRNMRTATHLMHTIHSPMDVYDPDDNDAYCRIQKAVDITDDCPKIKQEGKRLCLLLYYFTKKDIVVDIIISWNTRRYEGISIRMLFSGLEAIVNPPVGDHMEDMGKSNFRESADTMGISVSELRFLIEKFVLKR